MTGVFDDNPIFGERRARPSPGAFEIDFDAVGTAPVDDLDARGDAIDFDPAGEATGKTGEVAGEAPAPATASPRIEQLMQADPARPAPRERRAAVFVARGSDPIGAIAEPAPDRSRMLIVVRALLVLNLALLVTMLLLPGPFTGDGARSTPSPRGQAAPQRAAPSPDASRPPGGPATAPVVPSPPLGLPSDTQYEAALQAALEGRYLDAAQHLERYLERYPDLDPAVQRLVFDHSAYYLRKAGRIDEALRHENRSRAISGASLLPDELLRAAHEAETRGDGAAMRRAYARFLLQQDQASPALRAKVAEAYLKLGDAYRVEADAGAVDAGAAADAGAAEVGRSQPESDAGGGGRRR